MSTVNLIVTPQIVVMMLRGNTGVYESPLIGSMQTVDRGGLHWILTYTWTELRGDDRAEMMGLVAELRGQANRARVKVFDNPKRGAYGGTPLVNGASQTGSVLIVDGAGTVTDWIKRGDYFSVDVNGEHELKMATADASSSGGAVTLNFEPRLRFSPLNNAAIFVEDGTLPKPNGVFLLTNPETNWSSRPALADGRTAMSLQFTEDVFASM